MTASVLAITVALGGIGALLRLFVLKAIPNSLWWPIGVVNCIGSALVGVIFAIPESLWTVPLMLGLGGGLTTFSTLALLVSPNLEQKMFTQIRSNLPLLCLHVVLGVLSCFSALAITQGAL